MPPLLVAATAAAARWIAGTPRSSARTQLISQPGLLSRSAAHINSACRGVCFDFGGRHGGHAEVRGGSGAVTRAAARLRSSDKEVCHQRREKRSPRNLGLDGRRPELPVHCQR
uniref:Putative secreted protein n=1 Tax=Ixodes ricinus TaxID=34613 RepID=A0A6B0UK22_IXORI